jgi:hypothetical protein
MIDKNALAKEILSEIDAIIQQGTEPYRLELNKKIHVADVSFGALRRSAPRLGLNQYNSIVSVFKSQFKSYNSLEQAVNTFKEYKESGSKGGLRTAFVDNGPESSYIISGSYETLQRNVAAALKTSITKGVSGQSINQFFGTDDKGRTVVNIGHIAGKRGETTSPLDYQVSSVKDLVSKLGTINSADVLKRIQYQINKLHKLHKAETDYAYVREDLFKEPTNIASIAVVVTIQSAELNNNFSKTEAKISRAIARLFERPDIRRKLLDTSGSNNIFEDIAELIAFQFGVKRTSQSKHKPLKTKKDNILKGTKKSDAGFVKMPKASPVPTSTLTSLVTLQNILNSQLQKQIQENMGDGTRTDILNYQTGRFAESVKIVNLTQGRQGMLTAYYTYMKYPYATFSAGGKQEKPRSRDPKLLISRSIREIAQQHVANRMRAVLL